MESDKRTNQEIHRETYTETVVVYTSDWTDSSAIEVDLQHSPGDELIEVAITFDDAPSGRGSVFDASGDANFLSADADLGDLTDVDVVGVEPTNGDALIYSGGAWGPGSHGNLSGLDDPDHDSYRKRTGFPYDPDTGYEVSLSYSAANRQVTITPSGSTFDVWVRGVKYTKTGAQVSTAHADISDEYYIYYNESGVLTTSTTAWDLLKHAPVAAITYNATTASAPFSLMELHTADRDPELHYRLHFGDGTTVSSDPGLPVLSGFTLDTDTTAAVSFGSTAVKVLDEDIELDTPALADGGPYRVAYRTGASGEWTIQTSSFADAVGIPFLTDGTTICWNDGTGSEWASTPLATSSLGTFVNMYLCATTAITASERWFIVPGQQTFTSLQDAQNEDPGTAIDWGDTSPPEFVILAQLTYHARAVYSSASHYARLESVEILSGKKSGAVARSGVTDHGALSGLADDDHPQYALADGSRAFTGAVQLPVLTTTERDALSPSAGWTIFNSTTTKVETYDGSTWQAHW